MSRLLCSLILCILAAAQSLIAASVSVPTDYPTIQAAINNAFSGDTVFVEPGTYTGDGNRDLDFGSRSLTLIGIAGRDFTILDLQGDSLNPHRGIHFHVATDSAQQVRGLTFRNGWAEFGGALLLENSAVVTVADCCFEFCSSRLYGAAVAKGNQGDPPFGHFINCEFRDNYSEGSAGAVFWRYGLRPSAVFDTCTFFRNSALAGGVCLLSQAAAYFNHCLFENNHAIQDGGVGYHWAVYPNYSNCVFRGNSAGDKGGCFYALESQSISMNCVFENNSASKGGVCYWWYPYIAEHEDILPVAGTPPEVAVFPNFLNCTLLGNHASDSGSILYSIAQHLAEPGALEYRFGIFHSIIYATTGVEVVSTPNRIDLPYFSCTDIYASESGDWTGVIASQLDSAGNISVDPLFCDSSSGDFSLSVHSPCHAWNNGCDTTMGAFPVGCSDLTCGDVTGDGVLDISDLTFIIEYYLNYGDQPTYWWQADIDSGGSVDLADPIVLADYLFHDGPPPDCWWQAAL